MCSLPVLMSSTLMCATSAPAKALITSSWFHLPCCVRAHCSFVLRARSVIGRSWTTTTSPT